MCCCNLFLFIIGVTFTGLNSLLLHYLYMHEFDMPYIHAIIIMVAASCIYGVSLGCIIDSCKQNGTNKPALD